MSGLPSEIGAALGAAASSVEHVRIGAGLDSFLGETHVVLSEGALRVFTRGSILDPLSELAGVEGASVEQGSLGAELSIRHGGGSSAVRLGHSERERVGALLAKLAPSTPEPAPEAAARPEPEPAPQPEPATQPEPEPAPQPEPATQPHPATPREPEPHPAQATPPEPEPARHSRSTPELDEARASLLGLFQARDASARRGLLAVVRARDASAPVADDAKAELERDVDHAWSAHRGSASAAQLNVASELRPAQAHELRAVVGPEPGPGNGTRGSRATELVAPTSLDVARPPATPGKKKKKPPAAQAAMLAARAKSEKEAQQKSVLPWIVLVVLLLAGATPALQKLLAGP